MKKKQKKEVLRDLLSEIFGSESPAESLAPPDRIPEKTPNMPGEISETGEGAS